MRDRETLLQALRARVAACEKLCAFATDAETRALFGRLATHLRGLADEMERMVPPPLDIPRQQDARAFPSRRRLILPIQVQLTEPLRLGDGGVGTSNQRSRILGHAR